MPEYEARRFLAALAGRRPSESTIPGPELADDDYTAEIARAAAATEDLDAAMSYLGEYDLDALEDAVERAETDLSGRADVGRDALETLRSLRVAATGESQFHSGRNTHLGDGDVSASR